MATEVSIVNLALKRLGTRAIISFDDNNPVTQDLRNIYDTCRDSLLRSHSWNFAKKRIRLSPSVESVPFSYERKFPLPSDFLRIFDIENTEEYLEEAGAILSNEQFINLIYIARVVETNLYDANFVPALGLKIALKLNTFITQSNTRQQVIDQELKEAIKMAHRSNAISDPPIRLENNPFCTVADGEYTYGSREFTYRTQY